MQKIDKISIIGAGAWGSALSVALCFSAKNIDIYCKNSQKLLSINSNRVFEQFPSISVAENVRAVSELQESEIVIFALPSENLVEFYEQNSSKIPHDSKLIIATKGLNHKACELFSTYFEKKNIYPYFLSGPNFAKEVIQELESASILAHKNISEAKNLAEQLSSQKFKIIPNDDPISVQIAGIYKNILAIYSGYIIGSGLGENYRAKICTDGIAELSLICKQLGGNEKTAYSYAGLGDIMLSCFSSNSRNFKYGFNLSQKNYSNENIEGVNSCLSLAKICKDFFSEMPILFTISEIIRRNRSFQLK